MTASGHVLTALRDRRIVLARPAGQGASLLERLRQEGAEVILFPGMEIVALAESSSTAACLDRLAEADWAVFVSANAVTFGCAAMARRGGRPAHLRFAAVGAATARALEAEGCTPVLRPSGREDSEGLLAAEGWGDLHGRSVVIFRGAGGRETLAEGLRAAGARVQVAELYQRRLPSQDPAPLRRLLGARAVAAICAMSGETLHNVFEVCGPDSHDDLRATPWLVPHQRVAEAARALGIASILVCAGSSDDAVLDALMQHFSVPNP